MSTPFLLSLACGCGVLAVWYFRARAARSSKRAAAAEKTRDAAKRSAQKVQAALRGRR